MRWISTLCVLIVATIVTGCQSTADRTGQINIDRSFTTDGFRWESGGLVYIFVKARENQGQVEICAAYMEAQGAAFTYRLNRDVLAGGFVKIGDKRVLHGISFASQLPLMDSVVGQGANCVRSSATWLPGYADEPVNVEFPRMRFIL